MRYDNHLSGFHAALRRMIGGQSRLFEPLVAVVIALCLAPPGWGQSRPNLQGRRPAPVMSAQQLMEEGDRYREQGNHRAALDRYNQALRLAPNNPAAHLAKGWSLQNLNEHEQALLSFTEAQRLGHEEPYLVYWAMGESYVALNRHNEAISALSSAARLKPDSADVQEWLASAYFRAKQYANAKQSAIRAIQLDATLHHAQAILGDANFHLENYPEAVSAYQRALRLQPEAADVHYMAGRSYDALRRDRDAIQAYRQALRFKTNYPAAANYFMGWAHVRLRENDAAQAAFQQTLYLNSNFADAHRGMAQAFKQQGRYGNAVASTRKFVELRPADGGAYIDLSWYHSFLRQHEAAAQAGLKAIQHLPQNHMGHTNLCRALNDLGQFREALARCQRALQIKPGDGETLFYLGRAHEALKQSSEAGRAFAGAITGLREYVRQNPNEEDGYYLLGNAYISNNQPQLAIEAYRTAIRLQPHFAFARSNLGVAYLWVGNRQAALDQYRELINIDAAEAGKLLGKIEQKKLGGR
jgi:tetratricopeptide (TPR) repeat protein